MKSNSIIINSDYQRLNTGHNHDIESFPIRCHKMKDTNFCSMTQKFPHLSNTQQLCLVNMKIEEFSHYLVMLKMDYDKMPF